MRSEALATFETYLRAERGRSPATVRAYLGDLVSLRDARAGWDAPALAELDVAVIRSWLARLRTQGCAPADTLEAGLVGPHVQQFAYGRGLLAGRRRGANRGGQARPDPAQHHVGGGRRTGVRRPRSCRQAA